VRLVVQIARVEILDRRRAAEGLIAVDLMQFGDLVEPVFDLPALVVRDSRYEVVKVRTVAARSGVQLSDFGVQTDDWILDGMFTI
jgi:hypothetical protein